MQGHGTVCSGGARSLLGNVRPSAQSRAPSESTRRGSVVPEEGSERRLGTPGGRADEASPAFRPLAVEEPETPGGSARRASGSHNPVHLPAHSRLLLSAPGTEALEGRALQSTCVITAAEETAQEPLPVLGRWGVCSSKRA